MTEQEKTAQIQKDAAAALVQLAAERDEALEKAAAAEAKIAAFEQRHRAEKIALAMHEKNINSSVPFDALVEDLEKKASYDLSVIEQSVGFVGPDMMQDLNLGGNAPSSRTAFENYVEFGEVR
jgi:flagellar motility protein MotE (MotC chaperone)